MSSRRSIGENWLLVEWSTGGYDVVYVKSIVKPVEKELEIGEELTVNRKGEPEVARLIARARERDTLESMIPKEVAGPSKGSKPEDIEEDFSSSASSWTPSDDDAQSDDSATAVQKKKNLERYKRQYTNRSSKKVLTPSNKANAIVNTTNRKRSHDVVVQNQNNNTVKTPTIKKSKTIRVKMTKEIKLCVKDIMASFKDLFKQLEDMKKPVHVRISENPDKYEFQRIVAPTWKQEETNYQSFIQPPDIGDDYKENEHSENEEFNRSDDNVLITNKYENVTTMKTEGVRETAGIANDEWVPIGSGRTLIHRDKFKKINWKSYTVATRTLLMAVFPRKVLATHSLTGKCSPAFQNKPAKMCLDPKKTSDIILEIMDRFKVRENLVRVIITTKCADECKMWKTRNNKKKQNNKNRDNNIEKAQSPVISESQ